MPYFLLLALLPLDLGAPVPATLPAGPPGLSLEISVGGGRYRITHTWRGPAPRRFITGATDRNCQDPMDVLLVEGKVVPLRSELPCGGFAFRSARVVAPGEGWVIEGRFDHPVGPSPIGVRYCARKEDLASTDPAVRKPKGPPWWLGCVEARERRPPPDEEPLTISAARATSPWRDFTASYEEEQRSRKVEPVAITAGLERVPHLARYELDGEPLLAIDRAARRVVVNQRHLGPIARPEATRLQRGERLALGTVKSAALRARPRRLVRFLVESELIETYLHIGSTMRIVEETHAGGVYRARIEGTHQYFTNEENNDPLRFTVELDEKSGAVAVIGG